MRKYFPKYEEAVSHTWLCNCSILNFLIYEENLIFFFISVLLQCFYGGVALPLKKWKNINIKKQFNTEKKTVFWFSFCNSIELWSVSATVLLRRGEGYSTMRQCRVRRPSMSPKVKTTSQSRFRMAWQFQNSVNRIQVVCLNTDYSQNVYSKKAKFLAKKRINLKR